MATIPSYRTDLVLLIAYLLGSNFANLVSWPSKICCCFYMMHSCFRPIEYKVRNILHCFHSLSLVQWWQNLIILARNALLWCISYTLIIICFQTWKVRRTYCWILWCLSIWFYFRDLAFTNKWVLATEEPTIWSTVEPQLSSPLFTIHLYYPNLFHIPILVEQMKLQILSFFRTGWFSKGKFFCMPN